MVRSADLVPGDLVEVKIGDTIPADMRLYEAMNKYPTILGFHRHKLTSISHLEVDEALLTGESLPVTKSAIASFKEADSVGVGDRINMAYSSSNITRGRGKGIVTTTGMHTEIGKIAESLRATDSRVRKVRRNEDGSAHMFRYVEAGALTMKDQIGKFLGVSVGTPLQRKLSWLAIFLFGIAVVFAVICLAANKFSPRQEVILYAVG